MTTLLDKLDTLKTRHDELVELLSDPDVLSDHNRMKEYSKERAALEPAVQAHGEYSRVLSDIRDAREMLETAEDHEARDFARSELVELESRCEALEDRIKRLLVPKDPNDEKNTIIEIRAGTGGEEAALFAADLFRMYTRYAESKRWGVEVMNSNPTGTGGFKEVTFMVEGDGVYSRLKYESGVHRVQRVPATESQGRIHTSAATVAVLPEADEVEVEVKKDDIEVDVFRSSGPGGQSVNTTDSAVRITHKPTGLVVTCQDEKSQHKNKAKAMKVLRARLYEQAMAEQEQEMAEARRSQVSTGDRSAKIRTYNFPQSRVTDHRIGLSIHGIDQFVDGDLDQMIDALITSDEAEKIAEHT
ncbi:MAG: peptide chain release factor 1 [Candidatus Eisenbacteria bacterium]|nr:peptide chain release factor 1 [Candidatus Eisenbacteria bacterium]